MSEPGARLARRDDEDAAAVVTVLAAIAAAAAGLRTEPVAPRSFWGRPGYRLGGAQSGAHGWWASGLPR